MIYFFTASEADDSQWEYIPKENGELILVDIKKIVKVVRNPKSETKFKLVKKTFEPESDFSFSFDKLSPSLPSFMNSTFNSSLPTRFFIHGWQGDDGSKVNYDVIKEYFKHGNYNCIIVDWSRGSGELKIKNKIVN